MRLSHRGSSVTGSLNGIDHGGTWLKIRSPPFFWSGYDENIEKRNIGMQQNS